MSISASSLSSREQPVPEILSKQEIDSLLTGMTAGQGAAAETPPEPGKSDKEAVTFDFRLPHRLSKNQLRTFQAVHEGFGETFSSYLVSRLQANVTISVASVDQLFYSEYVLSIASPSSLYVFRILESDALGVLEVSPQFHLAMVEYLMGGVAEGEKNARLITKIEQSIVKGIIHHALEDIQRAWKTVAELTFKLERYESEGDFVQIAPASEIVMVVSFDVTVGTQKYMMSLCFPTFALENVLARLNMQHFSGMTPVKGQGDRRSAIARQIVETEVETVGLLGETVMTLGELLHLEPGDILRTNIPLTGDVQVQIGGKTRVLGRPGIVKGKMAIKVSKVLREQSSGA
jgi:flagellar motor switch protein FliM